MRREVLQGVAANGFSANGKGNVEIRVPSTPVTFRVQMPDSSGATHKFYLRKGKEGVKSMSDVPGGIYTLSLSPNGMKVNGPSADETLTLKADYVGLYWYTAGTVTLLDAQGAPALGTSTTAAWDFKSGDKYAVLRHHSTSLVIALSHTSNGWLRLREGDGKESQVMWTSGNRSGQAFDAGEIQILDDLKKRPGAEPLESRFGGAAEVKLGNWRLVRAGDGVDEVKMYNQSSLNVLRLDPWGVRIVGGSGDGGRLGSGVPQATAPRQFRVGDQVRMIAVPELECGSNIVAGDLCVIDEVDRSGANAVQDGT